MLYPGLLHMNLKKLYTFLLIVFIPFITIAQKVKIVKFDSILEILDKDSDKVRVVNFWATWCVPCVKELPSLEALYHKYDQLEVILVNLDFVNRLNKVERFVKKKKLKSKVVLLDEPDYNTWIDQVSPVWSGAIPATIIVGKKATHKKFLEGKQTIFELEEALKQFL